jgi:hypothetical protein
MLRVLNASSFSSVEGVACKPEPLLAQALNANAAPSMKTLHEH